MMRKSDDGRTSWFVSVKGRAWVKTGVRQRRPISCCRRRRCNDDKYSNEPLHADHPTVEAHLAYFWGQPQ